MAEIVVKLGENVVHRVEFEKETLSIGRARDNDIVVENLSVSRNHSRVRREGDKYILTDLNSANGTYVNGVRITKVEIVDEDVITIGKHKLHFLNKSSAFAQSGGGVYAPEVGAAYGGAVGAGAQGASQPDSGMVPVLVVTKGKQKDQEFPLTKDEVTIGRASDNDVRLHDWFVSKKHAMLLRQGSSHFIRDLGSWRGTMVNGKNVRDCELHEGDEVQLGTTSLTYKFMAAEELGRHAPPPVDESGFDDDREEDLVAGAGVHGPLPGISAAAAAVMPEPMTRLDAHTSKGADLGGPGTATAPPATKPPAGGKAPAQQAPAADDDFSPLSEDELEALEQEDEKVLGARDEAGEGEGHDDTAIPGIVSAESLALSSQIEEEEKQFARARGYSDEESTNLGADAEADEEASEHDDAEEEASLLGEAGLQGGPGSTPKPIAPVSVPAPAAAPAPAVVAAEAKPAAPAPAAPPAPQPETASQTGSTPAVAASPEEVALWEKAMKNKSKVIRRQAAKKLKELTGRDYDWESDPK